MKHYKLAFLGFGHVNQALASLLLEKQSNLAGRNNMTFTTTGIATGNHGSVINPAGIDLTKALESAKSGKNLDEISSDGPDIKETNEFIHRCQADVLFEAVPVNYRDGQPALKCIRAALGLGMHVFSANKGPVVFGYNELTKLAESKGVKYHFESAVMDGVPIFATFRELLPEIRVLGIRGILNSTTNLIISMMEQGASFEEALGHAQSIGVAETDPSGDIDGWDAAVKISALATVLMNAPTRPQMVDRTGIRNLTQNDIHRAKTKEKRWKLICEAIKTGDRVACRVSPREVGIDSPFYHVEGTSSIIQFETDLLGRLTILEENSNLTTTAYGMFADFLNSMK